MAPSSEPIMASTKSRDWLRDMARANRSTPTRSGSAAAAADLCSTESANNGTAM
jgi:hypothetical protein